MRIPISLETTDSFLTLKQNRLNILHGGTLACMVDLGGSLAVASRGLFATGVSTDLSGKAIYHRADYDELSSAIVVLTPRLQSHTSPLAARSATSSKLR
jgi:hypothetical protein